MRKENQSGNYFITGFEGVKIPLEIKDLIRKFDLFGVILFSQNFADPKQIRQLCLELQEIKQEVSPNPLLIGIDYEGGFVARFHQVIRPVPSAFAMGMSTSEWTRKLYHYIGSELRALGINCNFAPVLDVLPLDMKSKIGIRSFSSDPEHVAEMALCALKGIHDSGLVACGKHFPGLGLAPLDTHYELPVIFEEKETFMRTNIMPFRKLIDNDLQMLMTAHCKYPFLEKNAVPATFSREINTRLLRCDLNFKGVLVSDDIGMGAITCGWNLEEALCQSLLSGIDLVMVCHNYKKIKSLIQTGMNMIETGKISVQQIEQSELRRKRLIKFLLRNQKKETGDSINLKEIDNIINKISRHGLNCYKKGNTRFKKHQSLKIYLSNQLTSSYVEEWLIKGDFFKSLKKLFSISEIQLLPQKNLNPQAAFPVAGLEDSFNYDNGFDKKEEKVLFIGCDFTEEIFNQFRTLFHKKKIDLAICIKNPVEADLLLPWAETIFISYGLQKEMIEYLTEIIWNDFMDKDK